MTNKGAKTHEIKLDIQYCDLVNDGIKTFEIRRNDRNYQKGDLVRFIPIGAFFRLVEHPIKNKVYEITYVLSGWGLQEGFCVFAIKERGKGANKRMTENKGDLISRKALKEYARKVMCEEDFWTKVHLELFENIIDNAPTVNPYFPLSEEVFNKITDAEFEHGDSFYIVTPSGKKIEFEKKRPKGKWVKSKDGYTRCDQCGSRGSAIKARFCHHCGADMRGANNG